MWEHYRVCATCHLGPGSLGWKTFQWLCPSCERSLLKEAYGTQYKPPLYNGFVYSLMIWDENNKDFLSPLIHSLKGNDNETAWSIVVHLFIRKMILKNNFFKKAEVIVHAPAHNQTRQHAKVFATILGKQLNLPVDSDILTFKKEPYFKKTQRQVFRSRAERTKLQIIAKPHKYKKVLFVDDICTTGSTINTVKKALGPLSYFQPLVLACRENLFFH